MTNYIMPTSTDIPPIRVFFEENPYAHGPSGAKGIGELPMDGVAPAIANAIEQAVGATITRIPMTPESLMDALETAAAVDVADAAPLVDRALTVNGRRRQSCACIRWRGCSTCFARICA